MKRTGSRTRYPGVTKLKEGTYRVRVTWIDPKTGKQREIDRVVEGMSSPASAADQRNELRAQLEAEQQEQGPRMRVEDYARSWLSSKLAVLKPSTANRYASLLDLHILPVLGEMYADAVTKTDVITLRDNMAAQHKPRTVNSALRLFRTLFRDAVAELDLPRDPTLRVKALPELSADDDPNCLTAEELDSLLSAVRDACPAHYALFRTLAETGTRVGEATALRWDDIDEERMEIRIRRAHWRGHVGTTKTNRTRTVPMTEGLALLLAEHRRALLRAQAPGLAAGWVFPSKTGTLMFGPSLRKPLADALKAAKIGRRFTLHGFRRTFNNLLRQVTTGEVVRSMTGHVTERMTEHYSHIEAREKRAALGRVFSNATGDRNGDQGVAP